MDFRDVEHFKTECGYDFDDGWYPRVTKIVGIKAKPALYYFYAKMPSFGAAEQMKNQSAVEGTLVHDTIEGLLTGKTPVISPSIQASVDSFVRFLDEKQIQVDPNYVEYRLHHPEHRYAGTLDAIATIGGKKGIMDIKTSQAIYRDYGLQTSAYMAAMKPLIPELQMRWILRIDQDQACQWCGARLRKKGGRDVIRSNRSNYNDVRNCSAHIWGPMEGHVEIQEFPNWEKDFEAFLGAKRLWEWEHEEWLNKVGYV
ncbi:hypothetical protein CL629_04800 [bacterium]|nr:hypothetical protein [bacterium]